MSDMYAMLDEVAELAIAATTRPFAHLAPRYTAMAIHALETQLVNLENDIHATEVPHALILLRKIVETDSTKTFVDALNKDDAALVELMIESNDCDIEPDAFISACRCERTNIARLLLDLEHRVDSDALKIAFHIACIMDSGKIVRLILNSNQRVDSERLNTHFRIACKNNNTDSVTERVTILLKDFSRFVNFYTESVAKT